LSEKVEVAPDDNLSAAFPAAYPAVVEVTAGPTVKSVRVDAALGDPDRPLDDAAVTQKAQRVFAQIGEPRSAADQVALGLNALDDKTACAKLADALWEACKG